ncbi:MetQ/NlpA family ABC transporter substrate-binding protein [Culicoidibacter larvae]|uniref:Lipoprotein n=1 Tax=Culicoidibacter larvae TaxID=2579976 RepID=A0A5R8QED0_9FIRM|nr:MetQ/NlpA family ABC transporter substrate-binding protein [Culicoidibacter larvae]TLG75380.1 MetQ/NlpA family ABC transporter substrate-binding protein [Culicoidibacter larvae]
MKKLLAAVSVLVLSGALLAACSSNATNKLVVGASATPHAEILEQVKPILAEQGIELEIKVFDDYVLPNKALESGDLDANYFQHIPYLEEQIATYGYDFVNAGGIHIEPIGIYSQRYKSIDEVKDGASVLMSNSVADHGRVLALLEAQGLITLDPSVNKAAATIEDITSNPKNLQFKADYAPALMAQIYLNDEGDLVIINTNFAISAGLNPLTDSIAIEGADSPYVNIIAVRTEDKDDPRIKALVDALHSEEIQQWILDKYQGAVVPVE